MPNYTLTEKILQAYANGYFLPRARESELGAPGRVEPPNSYTQALHARVQAGIADFLADKEGRRTIKTFYEEKLDEAIAAHFEESNYLDSLIRARGKLETMDDIQWKQWEIQHSRDRLAEKYLEYKKCSYRLQTLTRAREANAPAKKSSFADLAQLRQNISPELFIGKPDRKFGHQLWYKCPLHNEDTSSFCWNDKKKLWYCFGSCARGGSIIDLVMQLQKISVSEAIKALQKVL